MIYNIQLLRFLSALSVLCAHLILFGNKKYGLGAEFLNPYADMMMMGVDVFFIISGFVMMETARRGVDGWHEKRKAIQLFLYRRIIRIYPVWWLLCLALLPVYFLKPEWINAGAEHTTSFLYSFFLVPYEGVPLIMVGWTLEYEMIFYLVFGMTLFLSSKIWHFILVSCLFASGVIYGFLFSDLGLHPVLEILTSSLLLYFILGMGLSLLYQKIPCNKLALSLVLVLLGASFTHVMTYQLEEIDRFMHYGASSALIVLLFLMLEKHQIIISKQVYIFGGDISYALYLVHILVISAMGRLYVSLGGQDFLPSIIILFVMGVISIMAASTIFLMFERPLLKKLRSLAP